MKNAAMLAATALALSACGHSNTAEPGAAEAIARGDVALWATAPDGTRLWVVEGRGGRNVYFSSGGTQTTIGEPCGKGCIRTEDIYVPAMHWPVDPMEGPDE